MKKLHLGSGVKRIPGFINVDLDPNVNPDVLSDLRQLPFETDSIDEIYACAVIEHFGRHEQLSVLKEWNRVLKPNSPIYISTTDFEQCVLEYVNTKNIDSITGLIIGGQKSEFDYHGMIFDFNKLSFLLKDSGFHTIKRYDWQSHSVGIFSVDDYSQAYIPHMDKESGRLMALNICALKL